MSGTFCDKGQKCENGSNLPSGSLEVLFMENQAQNSKCIINKRLMVLWQEKIKMLITKVQKKQKKNSETSTHSHPEEESERGCEKEREGSPIPIFSPLRFGIVRIFPSSVGFCSQVSAIWGKRGSTGLKLQPIVTRRRKLREVMRKRGKVPLYPYFHP